MGMLSAKQAAREIGTEARILRKFLRKDQGKVGQGKRWEIDEEELDDLRAKFQAWQQTTQSRGKTKKGSVIESPPAIQELDDLEELEDFDEPTDEDLELMDLDDWDDED